MIRSRLPIPTGGEFVMSYKRCFKCFAELPLEAFYKHDQMADGHLNKCIECTKRDVIANRINKISYYREYDKNRASMPHRVAARQQYSQSEAGRRSHAQAVIRSRVRFPDKAKARYAVSNAVRDGRLKRQPCWVCGQKAEAHHPDYSAPLDVVWLCAEHHKAAHKAAA